METAITVNSTKDIINKFVDDMCTIEKLFVDKDYNQQATTHVDDADTYYILLKGIGKMIIGSTFTVR